MNLAQEKSMMNKRENFQPLRQHFSIKSKQICNSRRYSLKTRERNTILYEHNPFEAALHVNQFKGSTSKQKTIASPKRLSKLLIKDLDHVTKRYPEAT